MRLPIRHGRPCRTLISGGRLRQRWVNHLQGCTPRGTASRNNSASAPAAADSMIPTGNPSSLSGHMAWTAARAGQVRHHRPAVGVGRRRRVGELLRSGGGLQLSRAAFLDSRTDIDAKPPGRSRTRLQPRGGESSEPFRDHRDPMPGVRRAGRGHRRWSHRDFETPHGEVMERLLPKRAAWTRNTRSNLGAE